MPASVVLLSGDEGLRELISDGLELAGGEPLRDVATEQELLGVMDAEGVVEAVCIGPEVDRPLAVAQRLHVVDRELAVVIVVAPERRREVEREQLFTAFLGPDVTIRGVEEAQILGAELSDAALRSRERRAHRATLASLRQRSDEAPSTRPLAGRHFSSLLDRAPFGAVTLDDDGSIRGWNRRAGEILGNARGPIGTPFPELFAGEERERVARRLAAASEGSSEAAVFKRETPDGSPQYLEISVAEVVPGVSESMVALQDVTDRVQAERRQQTLERELGASRRLLEAVVGGAADAVFIKDRTGRYLLINQAGAAILGRDAGEVVGRTDAEVMPPDAAEKVRSDDVHVMETREPQSFEEEVNGTVFLSTKAPYFDDEGNVAGVLGTGRDISQRKRYEEHSRMLNQAAAVLASLDHEGILRGVAELAVPVVADMCIVSVLGPDGSPEEPAFADARPEAAERIARALSGEPWPLIGAEVLRSGVGRLYDDVSEAEPPKGPGEESGPPLLAELGVRSAIVVPLPAHGGPIGTLLLGRSEDHAGYDEHDLRFAEELAARTAVSISNSRLHAERTRVAMTLQQSLLPPSLADIPGAELAIRFHAAGEGVDVGGDFYDAFEGQGAVNLVIGDVCGKGPVAAAVTALARYTIRAFAMEESRPDRILARLNEALLRQREAGEFCTVALIRVTPAGDGVALEAASGGHPLPIVVRADGSGSELGEPGTILGVVEDPSLRVDRAVLGPGDACVLYTDGLNEAAAPRLLTPENLAALVRPAAGLGADAIADRLDVIPAAAGELMRDDTAIVVLAVPAQPA